MALSSSRDGYTLAPDVGLITLSTSGAGGGLSILLKLTDSEHIHIEAGGLYRCRCEEALGSMLHVDYGRVPLALIRLAVAEMDSVSQGMLTPLLDELEQQQQMV